MSTSHILTSPILVTPPVPPAPTYKNRTSESLPTENPGDTSPEWESRKREAYLLYDQGSYQEAADIIWETGEIPSVDVELAFAARILAKASPRKAIRLLTALLELNQGKAVQNLALANALLHHGMVLQAARFYGAALEADPSLSNPDLEHFILWIDDEEKIWGEFKRRRPQLGELPWMRDAEVAMELTKRITLHTTPISIPSLPAVAGEELRNDLYVQDARKGAKPTPPPAVTIPMDRVDPKYRRFDSEMGAATEMAAAAIPAPAPTPAPIAVPAPAAIQAAPVHKPALLAIPTPAASIASPAARPAPSLIPPPATIPLATTPAAQGANEPSKPKFIFVDKKPS